MSFPNEETSPFTPFSEGFAGVSPFADPVEPLPTSPDDKQAPEGEKKKVPLFRGNFVIDTPVPADVLKRTNDGKDPASTHMRYTAATCSPDRFKRERYTLRPCLYEPPRQTEILIAVTMSDEGLDAFTRTMHDIVKNISFLCGRSGSRTWGKNAWKKVR
jgi:chitin synthase